MAQALYRLGHWCVRRRRVVLGAWLAVLVAAGVWAHAANGSTSDTFSIPGTESQHAIDQLAQRFPKESGTTMQIAVQAPAGKKISDVISAAQVQSGLDQLKVLPDVVMPSNPKSLVTVAPDGRTAFVEIRFDKPVADVSTQGIRDIIDTTQRTVPPVLKVEFGGDPVERALKTSAPPSDVIGLGVAVIVLLIAFGSIIAAGLPLFTALIGVAIAVFGISALSAFTNLSDVTPTLAVMIGLAVGIDYALFIVTRHRGFHARGLSPAESAARATATSGGAVVFAGSAVVIALVGLAVVGIPFLTLMGLCAAGAVALAVLIAITLVPAMLGFAGENIDKLSIPGMKVSTGEDAEVERSSSGRFAKAITDHPVPYLVVGIAIVGLLATPLLAIRLGLPDDGSKPTNSTQHQSYEILSEGFGPGFNGPLTVVVDLDHPSDASAALKAIDSIASNDADVAAVAAPVINQSGNTAVVTVVPKSAPASSATEDLVHRLRSELRGSAVTSTGARVLITGTTAANIDISAKLGAALPRYMAFVILLTMFLLFLAFRSILVPIKAAIAILLSIGASLGIVVAAFQWGWGDHIIGVDSTVPIVSFVPLMMFGILFGLSMDYEVFILSRVREHYVRKGDAHRAVLDGLAGSARVITAAALIMISVFAAFVLGDDVVIKMFGIGLAAAVLIDATLVRMIIVPSVMTLLDKAAWWLPRWLQRMPDLDVEGAKLLDRLESDDAVHASEREISLVPTPVG
ncbi:MAG TPA: MMPL family transporter [Acidimicrobiia bacterium]|jgi:RND superfamily putative drug exporter